MQDSSIEKTRPSPTRAAAAAAIAMTLFGIAPLFAADDAAPQTTLRYSQQSLQTEQGAREFYKKLVSAAETVCPKSSSSSPFITTAVRQCRDQAVAHAVQDIDDSRLAALHACLSNTERRGRCADIQTSSREVTRRPLKIAEQR